MHLFVSELFNIILHSASRTKDLYLFNFVMSTRSCNLVEVDVSYLFLFSINLKLVNCYSTLV